MKKSIKNKNKVNKKKLAANLKEDIEWGLNKNNAYKEITNKFI